MIGVDLLKLLLERYGIDSNKVIKNNENVLVKGNYDEIESVIKYLIGELKISPKNIEKAPSILYFNVSAIRRNVEFLQKQHISFSNVETCLHVLNTEPFQLEETYNYIMDNYGVEFINRITSILRVNVERIKKIEKLALDKDTTLSAAISRLSIDDIVADVQICRENNVDLKDNVTVFNRTADEVKDIVKACKENNIDPKGTVFNRTADEIKDIIEVCRENNVDLKDNAAIFMKTADEIKDIVKVCRENNIDPKGEVFRRTADEIKDIVKVCRENNIDPKGDVFRRTADEIKDIVKACKENNIDPKGNVFRRTADEIKDIIDVCRENNVDLKNNATMFMKTADEIKDIVEVCKENNIDPKGNVFRKTADEIKDIVKVCRENNVDPKGTVFQRTADEIKDIIEVCRENNIKITGSVFSRAADKLQSSMDFIKEHYDSSYLTPLIIVKDAKHLSKVFPYLDELGVLGVVRQSASILELKLDEIRERKNFVDSIGEPMVLENGKFNSVFGMSRKKYAERVSNVKKNSDGDSYGGK